MKIFKNIDNQVRYGWKIGLLLVLFIITTMVLSMAFSIVYGIVAIAIHPEFVSNQVKLMAYVQQQFSGMGNIPGAFLHLIQCLSLIFWVVSFWKLWDKGKVREIGFTNIKSSWNELCVGLLIGAVSFTVVAFILLATKSVEMVNGIGMPKFSRRCFWFFSEWK